MSNLKIKKGFTLIELLVVITIIGILATGATAVYTTQIQKARDTTRINDMKTVQSAIEQYYWDKSEYPANVSSWTIALYTSSIPEDAKPNSKGASWSILKYCYGSWAHWTWVAGQLYEISTGFENQANVTSKAVNDKWNDSARYELWIPGSWWLLDAVTATGTYWIGN